LSSSYRGMGWVGGREKLVRKTEFAIPKVRYIERFNKTSVRVIKRMEKNRVVPA